MDQDNLLSFVLGLWIALPGVQLLSLLLYGMLEPYTLLFVGGVSLFTFSHITIRRLA